MAENELEINAQLALQEFDNAIEIPNTDLKELGRKATEALDAFIEHWKDKPYMQERDVEVTVGEDGELKEYAERQIQWAEEERQRVRDLLSPAR